MTGKTNFDERTSSVSNYGTRPATERAAMSIHSFVKVGVFEPDVIAVMSEAFESACEALDDTGQPEVVLEIVAERIFAAASNGERDLVRLREAAIPWHERD